jgi:arylsulfatase A-like enzyme
MNKLTSKLETASSLVKQGDWSQLGQKAQRNIATVADPLLETATLLRDAYVYSRQHNANDLTQPFTSTSAAAREESGRKNVVWIMLDALRADVFETYLRRGGMASLAQNGVYFPRAFAQGSWTYPSVFSFLTARYPFNCGVSRLAREDDLYVSVCADFDETCPTIFSILRENGYQIGSILDGWGFTIRNTAGQEHREDRYFEQNWGWTYGQDRRFLTLEEQRDASLDFVQRAAPQGPFMLFMRSLYTHSPYRDIFKSADYVTTLSRRRWRFRIVEGFVRGLARFEEIYLKALMAQLEQLGQLDNTIIILCSDHGDMFWNVEDDLRAGYIADDEVWRHQLEPYNALVKVPLLIWGSGASGVYGDRFRLMDVLPTLLDDLGLDYDAASFDGLSLYRQGARPLYADSAGYGNGGIAFHKDGSKLLMSRRVGAAAYDISADEYEQLQKRRDGRAETRELLAFIEQESRQPGTIVDPEKEDHNDALSRRLKALGYL